MTRTTLSLFPCFLSALAAVPMPAQDVDAALAARRDGLQRAGVKAPLTLYPVRVLGRADANIADVLGLTLERQGMPDLQVAALPFEPGDTTWEQLPARFGAHVAAAAKAGEPARHALYAEYLGDPRKGPTEVRFVVVDAAGELVLVDRQTPADAAFQRTAGRDPDPLGCSRLCAERLFELAHWQPVAGGVVDGKFAARWQQKSGAPAPAERAAMDRRLAALRRGLGTAHLVVLPTVWPGDGVPDAARLAQQIGEQVGGKAVTAGSLKLEVAPTSNQQQRLWSLAKALLQAQQKAPLDADMVVVADIGLAPEGRSGYVNVVVVDRTGAVVLADCQNDQHDAFRRRAPKTLAAAELVAVDRLRTLLR